MKSTKIILLSIMTAFIGHISAQDLQEVLDSHFEAVNQEAVSEIKTIHMNGKSGRMGQSFDFQIWQIRPGKSRMEVDIQGQKMIQVYDGEKGYMVAPWTGSAEAQEVGETEAKLMAEQADMDGELWNWEEKGSQLTLEGVEDFEGTEVILLKLINKSGNEKTIYLDADSYLMIKMTAKIQMQGAEVLSESFFSNYKEVDGMVMPFFIENRMNGQVANSVTIETMEFDKEIDDKMFVKPEAVK